ncbi:MAG TPA: diphthamide biosynthesis enzyme Dph2 [Methanothrix sp.]|nr:diphthamide biosynthesis enzyme Dph2 [Methanothrix sp.]HQE96877.1 diphthamide biosynthesis enzyme Dph2 [Methanothrix sp.]HQJ79800.1 diphthamide biosynthesis enzyme Dph2 [Methanothrix sp.]
MARVPLTAGSSGGPGPDDSIRPKSNGCKSCALGASSGYDLDLEKARHLIQKSGARRIGLQAPEGLKRFLPVLARQIEDLTGAEVVISGDPCFGACDLDLILAGEVDLMLHLGHAELGEGDEKTIFLEARMDCSLSSAAKKAVSALRERRIGLATTIQHVHRLEEALKALRVEGIEAIVGPSGGRIRHPGQVLGCCYSSVRGLDVEEFLFLGTGRFHPLGIALATGKRVVTVDPLTEEVSEIDVDPLLRRRYAAICRAREAKRFAILVSKKPGQSRMALARQLKARGEASGREMSLVYLDNIEPDRLLNLGVQAAVSTACPRVALDDAAKYTVPILTPPEFEVLLGERGWEDYRFDEIED